MDLADGAKLFMSMPLEVFAAARRAAFVLVLCVLAAACNGNPGGTGNGTITVTAVTPGSGTTFGGTVITITGTNFPSSVTVTVGGTAATNVTVNSSTRITATTPAHAAGVAEVRVANGSNAGTLAGAFTFTAPSTVPNNPPVVSTLTVQAPREGQPSTLASTGDRMSLTASVNDAETAANQLTYEWTSTPTAGSFVGTGPAVQWTAPSSITIPQTVVLTLTVVEKYQEAGPTGLPVQREHRVQRSTLVKVHNTVKEVSDMAVDFLTLFSNSSLGPEAVLHNFSKTCDGGKGYNEERIDVEYSRANYVILSHAITPPTFFEYEFGASNACSRTLKPTPGDVCVEVPITWTDRNIGSTVSNPPVKGVDFVTGVYENSQWRLCHSRFDPSPATAMTGREFDISLRSRVIIKGPKDR